MAEINILSPHLADLIAAGEVVERPASVIKELCENSFDAGAKNLTLEIKDGGMTFIRVTDDGCGMSPEDAGVCFLRHATSKLKTQSGLESIGTMGFRGEALAAIASVSHIELLTRRQGENEGTRLILDYGEISEMTACGCPEGTTVTVRDLFKNTPARLKFMKNDRTEGSACVNIALRCALGRPEVSVRFLKDGSEEFFSPGDGKISSCAYSLLGRDIARELLEISSADQELSVSGYTGSPKAGHGNRAKQFFFCNGRCIKSQLLQAAVEQAYKNTLLTGRYPSCVVYLSISPAAVDVNVHPAKTEVKFRQERAVFDAVYYAALAAVQSEGKTADIKLSLSTQAALAPKKDFFKSMSAPEFKEKYSSVPQSSLSHCQPAIKPDAPPADRGTILWGGKSAAPKAGHSRVCDTPSQYNSKPSQPEAPMTLEAFPGFPVAEQPRLEICSEESASQGGMGEIIAPLRTAEVHEAPLSEALSSYRLIGETMKTYIIAETSEGLLLIDKHAAHERMIFDRLKAQGHEIMSQALLLPVTVKLPPDSMELLEENSELLERLGFELEPYGADCIVLRGLPADTDAADAEAMVEEICEKLKKYAKLSQAGACDEILHTVACKAAIKAGFITSAHEQEEIVKQVVSGTIKYCPHGRPVSIVLTKKQLDKDFSRIV